MADLSRTLLVYDADCRFCRACARLIAMADTTHRLAFLPMHDERAEPHVMWVPRSQRFKSFHLIEPTGAAYSRGPAVIATLCLLHSTSWLGGALRALRATKVMDVAYALVAWNRGRLGKLVRDAPGPIRWP